MAKHPITSKKHLRVRTPQTEDGITVQRDEQDRKVYKTTFLPLTAKRDLERENSKLPPQLKHEITEMPGDVAEPQQQSGGLQQRTAYKSTSRSTGDDGGAGGSSGGGNTSQAETGNDGTGGPAGSENTGGENDSWTYETLMELAKPDLQAEYAAHFSNEPKPAWTKEQLADAILEQKPIE